MDTQMYRVLYLDAAGMGQWHDIAARNMGEAVWKTCQLSESSASVFIGAAPVEDAISWFNAKCRGL